jgi:hypothetical protein
MNKTARKTVLSTGGVKKLHRYKLDTNYDSVRKLPDIPRELPKYVDRASYPGGILRILS